MQDAISILEKYKKIVWPEIEKYLTPPIYPKAFKIPSKYKKYDNLHWKIVRDYPERKGKYLRPTLVMLSAQSMGADRKIIIKTAAGMQVSEDWMLNHDDWEDNSISRRGKPALHRLYGNELAVNAGDALHAIMWKIFADNNQVIGNKKTWEIMDEFHSMLMRTTCGQATEIVFTKKNILKYQDADWFFIADGKTSYYTIATPMRLGAIIANATKPQLEKLADFGVYLGRCFQLVDDILDITSDFQGLKNQTGNDIYEGKRTILLGHLLRSVNTKDSVRLHHILEKGRDQKSEKEIKWVIQKMHEYNSIDYAKNLATTYRNKAYKIFENDLKFLKNEPYRSELETLIHFVLERKH